MREKRRNGGWYFFILIWDEGGESKWREMKRTSVDQIERESNGAYYYYYFSCGYIYIKIVSGNLRVREDKEEKR